MNRILVVLLVCLFSSLGFNPSSYGAPDCPICLTETEQDNGVIQCSEGHQTHQECLNEQIKALEDIREIRTIGLRCHGADSTCEQRFLLDEISRALNLPQREALNKRLSQACEVTDKSLAEFEFRRLSQGIQDAFNLVCPAEGCGGVLAQIEGCNAATCQDSQCKTTFCYLCLEQQANSQSAHAHVRDQHSGDYWDYRPGYPERYHWLLVRKELASLFKKKVDPTVKESVLRESKRLLEERNMWPLPSGKMTASWLREVQSDRELSRDKKIELLQNEAIYQRQIKNTRNTTLVDAEIQRLGGIVLASLDVKDAAGVYSRAQNEANPAGGNIIPVLEDDPRVVNSPEFVALGNMYQIGNWILSGVAPRKMNQRDAVKYCESLDAPEVEERGWFGRIRRVRGRGEAILPTWQIWEGVGVAMGRPNNYNPNLLPDTRGNWFWSSSVPPDYYGLTAYKFNGDNGYFYYDYRNYEGSVRCVRPGGALQRGN